MQHQSGILLRDYLGILPSSGNVQVSSEGNGEHGNHFEAGFDYYGSMTKSMGSLPERTKSLYEAKTNRDNSFPVQTPL